MDLHGWTPIYGYQKDSRFLLDFCFTGDCRFTEPFMHETVQRLLRDPAVLLFRQRIEIERAAEWCGRNPGMKPAGFIFHMSRCGSTLVAQMLSQIARNRVLSEPAAIHSVLASSCARAVKIERLRTVVSALGRPVQDESQFFIKLDCWHTLDLPLLLEAFPGTPWIFVYRSPAEVLVSHARMPGAWLIPGLLDPGSFGLNDEAVSGMSQTEYRAHLLARICEAALEFQGVGAGMLVNYGQLPGFVLDELPAHFGVSFSAAELDLMRVASQANAKVPGSRHRDDRTAKQLEVTAAMREALSGALALAYARLELSRRKPSIEPGILILVK